MSELLTEKTESIVILDTPVQRGATSIREVVLRKPQSGALRGLRLQAVMEMDVASMMTIIPRISSPELTPQEMAELTRQTWLPCRWRWFFLLPKSATSAFQPA